MGRREVQQGLERRQVQKVSHSPQGSRREKGRRNKKDFTCSDVVPGRML